MLTLGLGVGIFWFVVLFCDTIFKTCLFYPYFKFLQISGLDIRLLLLRVHVTRFNRFLNQMGRRFPLLVQRWFDIGTCITCALLIPSMLLYIVSLYQIFRSSTLEDYDSSVLVPVVPGYNIPLYHLVYFIIIILLCYIVHEFGHALAASRERISIEDCGIAVYVVFPAAFVNIRFDQFKHISLWQQLRIICGGIWHNIFLSLLAFSLWYCIMPVLSTFFYTGIGVTVLGIQQQSPLNQLAGFEVGDQIITLGNCKVQNQESWKDCLRHISSSPQSGFCISEKLYENTYVRDLESCVSSPEYIPFHVSGLKERKCLPVRPIIQNATICSQRSDCEDTSICIFPILTPETHRLITIRRHKKSSVLYEGTMDEIYRDVEVSNFVPKLKFLPASCAEGCITFLLYIIMFSSGLAILNMMPVFSLDGEYLVKNLVHLCLAKYVPKYNHRTNIIMCINKIGMILLTSILILSAYKLYTLTL